MYKNEEWLRRMKGWYYLQEAKGISNKFQNRTWEVHQLISTTKFKYTLFSTEVYREQNKTMLFHSLEYTYAILLKQWIMLNIFTIIKKHYKKEYCQVVMACTFNLSPWEGNSVNTEPWVCSCLCSTPFYTPFLKGMGNATYFTNMVQGIDRASTIFGPGGADTPLYSKY